MEKHHGKVVERIIRNKGFSVTAVAKALKVNRRSLYNWFESERLKTENIYSIGMVVGHDFSIEFPELFDSEQFQNNNTVESYASVAENEAYKEKYLKLLESYNELLVDAVQTNDDHANRQNLSAESN